MGAVFFTLGESNLQQSIFIEITLRLNKRFSIHVSACIVTHWRFCPRPIHGLAFVHDHLVFCLGKDL
jgi:hypothetical protein